MTYTPIPYTATGIRGPKTFKHGYLNLDGKSNLVFEGVTFSECGQVFGAGAHHITFRNCHFVSLSNEVEKFIQLLPGNDDWLIEECHVEYTGDFIYSNYSSDPKQDGAQRVTVRNCTGKYIGTSKYHPSRDGHFVGLQGGSGHIITGNHTENTGTAIELWARKGMPMRNCLIAGNTIRGTHALKNEDGSGIKFSGEPGAAKGLRTGNICRANDIQGCDGFGISSNWPDEIQGLSTNTIKFCKAGNLRVTGL
jgi:hypothetical protein